MFVYDFNPKTGLYQISSRSFREVKLKLLFQLTNRGLPSSKSRTGTTGTRESSSCGTGSRSAPPAGLCPGHTPQCPEDLAATGQFATVVEDKPRLITFTGENFEETEIGDQVA